MTLDEKEFIEDFDPSRLREGAQNGPIGIVILRDCLTRIKVGIAIYQSKALFKGYCRFREEAQNGHFLNNNNIIISFLK